MNKTKKLLLISCILFAAGGTLYLLALAFGARVTGISLDSTGLHVHSPQVSSEKYSISYKEETVALEDFNAVEIDMDFGDVSIELSDRFALTYRMASVYDFTYEVKDGRLKLVQSSQKGLRSNTSITLFGGFDPFDGGNIRNGITLYLPADTQLSDFTANCGSVDFTASGLNADQLNLKLNFGSVELTDLLAENCTLDLESANLSLTGGKFSSLNLSNNFGTVKMTGVSAQQPSVIDLESVDTTMNDASFADLKFSSTFGSFISSGITVDHLDCTMESGDADLKSLSCESLYMKSTFGSVDLLLTRPLQDYTYSLSTDFGSINVGGKDLGTAYKPLFEEASDNLIEIIGDSTDININSSEE